MKMSVILEPPPRPVDIILDIQTQLYIVEL